MGVKSMATKGGKSEKKKEDESEPRTGEEEDVNPQAEVSMGSVDRRDERKEKKKKKKESGDRGGESVEGEEERPEEQNGGKKGMYGSEDLVKDVETNSEKVRDEEDLDVEVGGGVVGSESDHRGHESEEDKKEKKTKKKRKRENAIDGSEEKVKASGGEREERKKKKKKSEKKRKGENGSDGVEDDTQTDEEGIGGKKIKETESESGSGGAEGKVEADKEGGKSKKKKKTRSEDISDGTEDKAMSGEEVDGEKKKKTKKLKCKSVSEGVEVEAEMDEETGKSKKTKKTKSESVSDGVDDKAETDEEVDKSKKKKKKKKKERKSQDISSAAEEDKGKNEDHRKENKKKAKAGKGEEGKARTENGAATSGAFENPTSKSSKRVSFSDVVEVFDVDSSKKVKSWKKCKKEDGLVQGKRFTPEEDEIVKDAVLKYIEAHNLGENGLEMVLNCRLHKEVRHCWKEIAEALPQRPLSSVYYRAHILFERADTRKWTDEERAYVQEFYKKHGADWKQLAIELKKHRFHCKDTWRRNKLLNRNKGRWNQEEYQGLFDLVNKDLHMRALEEERDSKHGMIRDNICWQAISDKLATRNISTCCSKWYKQLTSPMVEEGWWSDTDDYRLISALSALDAPSLDDVDWDSLLGHRDGNTSLKRWNQMVKHIGDYAKLSFSEQVEVLAKRYSSDCLEAREEFDSKPVVDGDNVKVNDSNLNEAVESCP